MTRYDRAGGVFDINRSLRKTREEFEQAYEDVAAVVSKNTEKGSDIMTKSKRHYIADEELGGIEREYTETDRKAGVGDYVVGNSGAMFKADIVSKYGAVFGEIAGVAYKGDYKTLSPTDIIRHNGERYHLVDRKAEVGEIILVNEINQSTMRDMTVGGTYIVTEKPIYPYYEYVNVFDDVETRASAFDDKYYVLEPVIDEQETDAPPESQPDSTPDLVDLVIRLTRKVAELEETVNNADYKAGQALTTAELQAETVELLSDDYGCTCRRCCR